MKAPKNSSLYNQDTLQDDDFVAQFVARHDILDALLRRLRAVKPDQMGQHQILIGPRGMGKTSLLRRLAIEINSQPDLNARYIPLRFREEQYNVLRLGDFWRNCGEALAEWAEASGQTALANRLDATLPGPDWAGDDSSAERFEAEVTALGRRAVLLVDNLDLIIDALPDKDRWVLRKCLQRRSGPVTIGAATQLLKDSADRSAAFYEFFQPHHLEPLDENETKKCMFALAHRRGELGRPVLAVLAQQPGRLKTLHTLTGGNPRILALIYRLLESAESDAALADLEILLDQVTPYYKARIEEYQTPQQRAVIDAIGLHWDPITTGDLSRITDIPSTTLSPLLIKLKREGLIENVETSSSYAGHQFVERFLNIWYLMRHGTRRAKQKMRWLVAFLSSYYSPLELSEIASRLQSNKKLGGWHPDYVFALNEALRRNLIYENLNSRFVLKTDKVSRYPTGKPNIKISDDAPSHFEIKDARETISKLELARDLIRKGVTLGQTGEYAAAIAAYDDVIVRFADAQEPALKEQVARALILKGFMLDRSGDHAAAIANYDDLIARFADAQEPAPREWVARALFNKGFTLRETGDLAAAIAVFDDVIARFADAQEPALREQVASALVSKGLALGDTGDHAAAIAVFDDMIARFADAQEPALREQVASALVSKGLALGDTGDHAAAIAVFDDMIARFADAQEPALKEQVAWALGFKGLALGQTGDHAAEITVYDDVAARYAGAQEPVLRERVAGALFNKGLALAQTGDHAAEIAVYDQMIARFADAQEPVLRELVARALFKKGFALGQTGDHAAATTVYDDVAARYAGAQEPVLRERVASALFNKGLALGQTGDYVAAITVYDEVAARFAEAREPAMQELVARALFNKGLALDQTGDYVAAITVYDEVAARFADAQEPALREQVARALFNKGFALGRTGDYAAAITVNDDVVARFADAQESALREGVARALINKGFALRQTGDYAEEIAVYDDVVARFADAKEPALRELVARALINKGLALGQSGDNAGAIAVYDDFVVRFVGAQEPALREQVAATRIRLANLMLDLQGDVVRAERLYQDAREQKPLVANANLAWLYLAQDKLSETGEIRKLIAALPETGLALIDAAIQLGHHNFGSAMDHLKIALDGEIKSDAFIFEDDLDRFLRLAKRKGCGEQVIAWLEETAFADRIAPVYVAMKAYVRGEKALLDVNPETREPAKKIFDRLAGAWHPEQETAHKTGQEKRRRGRPRKI